MGRYIPKHTLNAGIEDNEPELDPNKQPVVWDETLEEEPTDQVLESDAEHDLAVQNIETLEEAQQALESLHTTLLSIGAENYTNGVELMLNNGVNQALRKFDITSTDLGIEDYGTDRVHAFNVSVEKISETAKGIGKKVIAWIRDLLAKIKTFLGEIFNTVTAMRGKIERLLDASRETKYQANEDIILPPLFSTGMDANEVKMLSVAIIKMHAVDQNKLGAVLRDTSSTAEEIRKVYADQYSEFFNSDIVTLAGGVFVQGAVKDGRLKLSLHQNQPNKKAGFKSVKTPSVSEGVEFGRELLKLSKVIIELDKAKGSGYTATARIIEAQAKLMSDQTRNGAIMNCVGTVTAFERSLIKHASKVLKQGIQILVQVFKPKGDPANKQIEHKAA